MSASHNALVVPTLDSYVVSCSCGWVGESHNSPEPAERESKRHEDNPTLVANGRETRPGTGQEASS